MGKKRKSDAARLDEVCRTMYSSFCNAANSLSHLYSHTMQHQKLFFQAGERHSLEKRYDWILRQQENGNGLDYGMHERSPSPRVPHQQQHHTQILMQFPNSGLPVSSNLFSPTSATQGIRSGDSDQGEISVHSALRTGNIAPNHRCRNTNHPTSNDISMDTRVAPAIPPLLTLQSFVTKIEIGLFLPAGCYRKCICFSQVEFWPWFSSIS